MDKLLVAHPYFMIKIYVFELEIFIFLYLIYSFVSEHIETLEEIDVEYKELALESGIEKWGRVPALGCEPSFISDLADAVIESLPYVGVMAVSNLEARQVILIAFTRNFVTTKKFCATAEVKDLTYKPDFRKPLN